MHTDKDAEGREDRNPKLLLKEETGKIIGCAFDVLNEVGPGFHEKIYENGMVAAFKLAGIVFDQQKRFPVSFRGQLIGEFIPDLLAFGTVVVDAKTIDRITEIERGQMLSYLRITKMRIGLVLNFKHPKLEWERIVL